MKEKYLIIGLKEIIKTIPAAAVAVVVAATVVVVAAFAAVEGIAAVADTKKCCKISLENNNDRLFT